MESKLEEYLIARGAVSEECLEEMKSEKIDMEAILHMSFDQLRKFIPKVGDQIAVTNFCRRYHFTSPSCSQRTLSLIQKIKHGRDFALPSTSKEPERKTVGPGRPPQQERIIQLGWKVNGKLIRAIRGGGTRNVKVNKSLRKPQILKKAIDEFFPGGVSKFGKITDFQYDLLDFQENELQEDITVGEMFESVKLSTLRFYLVTNNVSNVPPNTETAHCSHNKRKNKCKCNVRQKKSKKNREEDEKCETEITNDAVVHIDSSVEQGLQEFLVLPASSNPSSPPSKYSMEQFDEGDELMNLLESNNIVQHAHIQDMENVDELSDLLFDNDTVLAIQNSLDDGSTLSSISNPVNASTDGSAKGNPNQVDGIEPLETLETIMRRLNNNISKDKIAKFNIYRQDIFHCCIRAMRRKTFSPFNKISVRFSDMEGKAEGAVDAGGPSREMFRLVLKYIKESRLFFGEEKKSITLDGDAKNNDEYFEAGRLMALSLIHGGPGVYFFSKHLYSLIVRGIESTVLTLEDIEPEIREKISKINILETFEALQQYVEDEPIFAVAGRPIIRNPNEKEAMFADLINFYGYVRVKPALEQLESGLNTGGLLDLMRRNPTLFEDIMCGDKPPLRSDDLNELFKIRYSDVNSSARQLENRTITFWREFVDDCEEGGREVSLDDIMIFATGTDRVPPLGFDVDPTIIFEKEGRYPSANTCGLQLRLPTSHKKIEDFKSDVAEGIGNCKDFALA